MIANKKPVIFNNGLTLLIFAVGILEIIAMILSFDYVQFAFRPLVAVLILYLYWHTSHRRNIFFGLIFLSLIITSICILFTNEYVVALGLVSIVAHRIMLICFLLKLNKIKDYAPIFIAIVPFISIFSYLLYIADEISNVSYYVLIIQNILVSIFAGIILSNYFMNQDRSSAWLSIFGLLATSLYFIVFIEKCFMSDLPPTYFRPLSLILFASTYYSFYKSVIDIERANDHVNKIED